jgi:CubicO group peptidase (beta-lactamase class C family)
MNIQYWISVLAFLFAGTINGQPIVKSKVDMLMKKAELTHSEAIIVYQNNKLVVERYFGIGKPDKKIESMSATKSVVGLAVGCMLSDKLLDSLDVPIYKFYPEWKQGQKQYITLRHILQMTSGLQNDPVATKEIYPSSDFVKLALAAELSSKPGEVWSYNNKALNLMAGIIKQITGKRMDKYIAERLFKPLDIKTYNWILDPAGNPHVMSGCQVKPSDFIKFGFVILNKGRFNGKEILSPKSLQELITPCEQYKGYGILWWIDYKNTVSIVDDSCINKLREVGIENEFISKVEKMKGVYNSDEEYLNKIKSVFGDNPWEYINKILGTNLKIRRKEFSGDITYRADGYLGNYIIIDPKNKIVAIRMISGESYQNEQDSFNDFRQMILGLIE